MRGAAALGVLTTHTALTAGQLGLNGTHGNGIWGILLNKLEVSLPLFFVLSGLLLYRPFALATIAATRKPDLRPYFWRRFLRTMPAYWTLAGFALALLNWDQIHSAWQVIRPLLLLQVYQHNAYVKGMEQTWSLATEVAFYAALPLMAWALNRIARGGATPLARLHRILVSLGVLVVVGFAFSVYTHQAYLGQYPIQDTWPLANIGFIAIGMGLAAMSASAEASPETTFRPYRLVIRWPVLCWAAALVTFVLICANPLGDQTSADYPPMAQALSDQVLYQIFALFIIAPLTVPFGRSRFLIAVMSNPVMRFIGRISYGVYLWHISILYFVNHGTLFNGPNFFVLMAMVLPASVGCATLSWYIVEKPAMKLRERLGKATAAPSVAMIAS